MIDLHSHILPGIDDGASSLEISLDMLAASRAIGTETIVATPHLDEPLSPEYAAAVQVAFHEVQRHAQRCGVELLAGFEVRLTPDVPARLRAGEPITLGESRTVLVDLPFIDWPHYVDSTLFDIQTAGYHVILAHPERYPRIQQDPDLALELAQRGIALQATAGSFTGIFGKGAKRAAEALLKLGAVHLVATDAHSAGHRMAAVPAALARLESLVGEEGLRQLAHIAPAAVLVGAPLPEPPLPQRRSILRRILLAG